MNDLKPEFERNAEKELENAEGLEKAVENIRNSLVKELIQSISMDSKKHASFYRAIVQHIENPLAPISEEEYEELERAIRRHIEIEEEMIKFIQEVRKRTVDKRVEFILKSILVDEHRHHELLRDLLELVIRKELVTEDEWEDLTWNIMLDGV
jgi:rubrerythrin